MKDRVLPPGERTIVFAGVPGSRQHRWERSLSGRNGNLVICCGGQPEEVMRQCRKLLPCVLIVDRQFLDSVDAAEFEQLADFGQAMQVLVEIDPGCGPDVTEKLLRMGCSGVLDRNASTGAFHRALRAVASGELWVDRKTTSMLLRSLLREDRRKLTDRENEILLLAGEGLTNAAIAKRLFISPQTVRWHLRSLYGKLGVHDRSSAEVRAYGARKEPGSTQHSTGPGTARACAGH